MRLATRSPLSEKRSTIGIKKNTPSVGATTENKWRSCGASERDVKEGLVGASRGLEEVMAIVPEVAD